jgi:hypothetical protein
MTRVFSILILLSFISLPVLGQVGNEGLLAKNTLNPNTLKSNLNNTLSLKASPVKAAGFFTILPAGSNQLNNISNSAEITGITIKISRNMESGLVVYDEQVRLYIQNNVATIEGVYSENKAYSAPWENGATTRSYGGNSDNWGLNGISVSEIIKNGLKLEISTDEEENSELVGIEVSFQFGNSIQSNNSRESINQGRFR